MTRLARLAALFGLTAGLLGAFGVAAPPALAHPLGNFTVTHYSGLDLWPGSVRIQYVVDMAEIPTYQETPNIDTNGDGTITDSERQAWADRTAPALMSYVTLRIDGTQAELRVASDAMSFRPGQAGLPILRMVAVFVGSLPSSAGRVEYQDRNYPGRIGWKEITARSEPGLALTGSSVPAASVSNALLAYPVDMLSSPLDVTTATFSFHPGPGTAAGASGPGGRTVSGAPVASGGSFAGLVRWRLTPLVLALSLLLAFGFGSVHALGPGHGKTITAAYLVGSGARRAQAAAVGIAVSLMHTASVLALGLVFLVLARSFPPERVYPWLELVTGLVALGLGSFLLVVRIRATRRGMDPWHGHTHPGDRVEGHGHAGHQMTDASIGVTVLERAQELTQDHPHTHPSPDIARSVTPRSLLALAVAGGILPSPTAFVVLLGAVRAHRIAYGLGLILAFSVGLAAALVLVGVFALRARSVVSSKLTGRWGGLLPIGSAILIVGFGLFFVSRGSVRIF
jgi:ABC-type nickel/cobalt efflux system permease component RcnA